MMARYGGFKYKVIKRLYNRAITFREESNTKEKREAWGDVVTWLESFYGQHNRRLSKNGVICLTIKNKDVEKIDMIGVEGIVNKLLDRSLEDK